MYVCAEEEARIKGVVGKVYNTRNHPKLSVVNLAIVFMLRLLQNRNAGLISSASNTLFCGSIATPGNGHDLSKLSGLAVAESVGADYPFPDLTAAHADFGRLKWIMGFFGK
jgi:hypothetical protein